MVDNIMLGNRFLGRRKPAWWDIKGAYTFPADAVMTASQATQDAGLNYEIVKAPLIAVASGPFGDEAIELEGKYALMRMPVFDDPHMRPLGMCGEGYDYFQNQELAQLLDPIAEHYPVETVGALGNGETVFFCFKGAKVTKVAGEPYELYFVFSDTRDGGTKAKMAFTPVRIECQNTLVLGLSQAVVTVPIAHNRDHRDMVGWQLKMLTDMAQAQKVSIAAIEALAKVALTAEDIDTALALVYPTPKVPAKASMVEYLHDAAQDGDEAAQNLLERAESAAKTHEFYVNRAKRFRGLALELYQRFNDDRSHKKLAGSAYALFQAVCESADYREGSDTVGESALFGDRSREKIKAWKALAPLAGVK